MGRFGSEKRVAFGGGRTLGPAPRSSRSSMAGLCPDGSSISPAERRSPTGSAEPAMGGFFLLCRKPDDDKAHELAQLQRAFAELGFASPEIIKAEQYIFAAYPSFQSSAVVLKRDPSGDFIFVCGTCLSERGLGVAAAASLYEGVGGPSPASEEIMGHYAAV